MWSNNSANFERILTRKRRGAITVSVAKRGVEKCLSFFDWMEVSLYLYWLYMTTMVLICGFYLIRGLSGSDSLAVYRENLQVPGEENWIGYTSIAVFVSTLFFVSHRMLNWISNLLLRQNQAKVALDVENILNMEPSTRYIQTLCTSKKNTLRAAGICCLALDHPRIVWATKSTFMI
jgi:hypothetical protein